MISTCMSPNTKSVYLTVPDEKNHKIYQAGKECPHKSTFLLSQATASYKSLLKPISLYETKVAYFFIISLPKGTILSPRQRLGTHKKNIHLIVYWHAFTVKAVLVPQCERISPSHLNNKSRVFIPSWSWQNQPCCHFCSTYLLQHSLFQMHYRPGMLCLLNIYWLQNSTGRTDCSFVFPCPPFTSLQHYIRRIILPLQYFRL